MADLDLYDDILSGNLSPSRVPSVETLLELGGRRLVLRLPGAGCPLRAVQDAVRKKLSSDATLRESVGGGKLVVQRRSHKFGTWVDMVAGDKPLRDGERLKGRVEALLEAGEVQTSDEGEKSDGKRRRSSSRRKRSSRKHRHRHSRRRRGSDSSEEDSDRRRRRKRHRRRRDESSDSDASSDERRRRHRHRRSKRRRRRSASSDTDSSRSASRSRSRSGSTSSSSRASARKSAKKKTAAASGGPLPPPPPTIGPVGAVAREIQTWNNMDPDFAEALRSYKNCQQEEAEKEGPVPVSEDELPSMGELSSEERDRDQRRDSGASPDGGGDSSDMAAGERSGSESADEVGTVLMKARRESTNSPENVPEPRPPEPGENKTPTGQVYAAFLGLMSLREKNPTTALHEYCASRRWPQPKFQLTEQPGHTKKHKLFKCSVKVDGKMYHMTEPATSKKDAKRDVARLCLESQGVLPKTGQAERQNSGGWPGPAGEEWGEG